MRGMQPAGNLAVSLVFADQQPRLVQVDRRDVGVARRRDRVRRRRITTGLECPWTTVPWKSSSIGSRWATRAHMADERVELKRTDVTGLERRPLDIGALEERRIFGAHRRRCACRAPAPRTCSRIVIENCAASGRKLPPAASEISSGIIAMLRGVVTPGGESAPANSSRPRSTLSIRPVTGLDNRTDRRTCV